jgi:hypothetical protein
VSTQVDIRIKADVEWTAADLEILILDAIRHGFRGQPLSIRAITINKKEVQQ